MDVFFCDLCAARVTDTDLTAGQGQRRGYHVICAACVHKGQGQSWLSQVDASRADASARLIARQDRAKILNSTVPTFVPVPSPREQTIVPVPAMARISHPNIHDPNSGANGLANGFASLLPPSSEVPSDSTSLSPSEPAMPTQRPPTSSSGSTPRPTTSRSNRSANDSNAGQKGSSTRTNKPVTSRTTPPSTTMLITGGIAAVVLVVFGILLAMELTKKPSASGGHSDKPQQIVDNLGTEEISRAVAKANELTREASGSKDKQKIQKALAALQALQPLADDFEKRAKKEWGKSLSEEQVEERVGQKIRGLGVNDALSKRKLLNDELARIH